MILFPAGRAVLIPLPAGRRRLQMRTADRWAARATVRGWRCRGSLFSSASVLGLRVSTANSAHHVSQVCLHQKGHAWTALLSTRADRICLSAAPSVARTWEIPLPMIMILSLRSSVAWWISCTSSKTLLSSLCRASLVVVPVATTDRRCAGMVARKRLKLKSHSSRDGMQILTKSSPMV